MFLPYTYLNFLFKRARTIKISYYSAGWYNFSLKGYTTYVVVRIYKYLVYFVNNLDLHGGMVSAIFLPKKALG